MKSIMPKLSTLPATYLKRVSPVVRSHNGFIDRYTGDSVMALFPNDVEDAILSSIETQKLLRDFNAERHAQGHPAIDVGIGLHSGTLRLGIVGEAERMQGDIFSDAVNLANRLEGLCKLYGVSIVVSEHTLSLLDSLEEYQTRFLGRVRVKGKMQAVSVFEIYDGDPEEAIEFKLKTKADFEAGLNRYFEQDFEEAGVSFRNVLELSPEDKTAKLYLERCAQFMVQGVPEDWQGVEEMDHK